MPSSVLSNYKSLPNQSGSSKPEYRSALVAESDHFMLMKDNRENLIWSKPQNFQDKDNDQKVRYYSMYNNGVKSFLKTKLSKKQQLKMEEEFKKRGDQARNCTQYSKADSAGYVLVPLMRKFEKPRYVKKDSIALLQLLINHNLPVCRQNRVSLD
jgi:hypothetical protein